MAVCKTREIGGAGNGEKKPIPPIFNALRLYTIITVGKISPETLIGAFMKKMIFVLVIGILAIGTISAQVWGAQSVTVEGTLQLQNGQIAVASGNTVYFVPVLARYIGFIDGLREGARVSISGYASGNILQATQVTINGKSYNFQASGYGSCCSGWGSSGGGMRW
jgi:hypothetical protein